MEMTLILQKIGKNNMDIDNSVFINCPYDPAYNSMRHSMLFTIVTLGYNPRLAIETTDSCVPRLDKIIKLIKESDISIHDLSRIKSKKKNEFSRMNMPYELGLDFGCKKYSSSKKNKSKKFLIIGDKKYDYMRALSDLSGIDIEYHNNKEINLIKAIRHWFVINLAIKQSPSPMEIWNKLMDFNGYYIDYTRKKKYTVKEMYEIPLAEQIQSMKSFLADNPF